MSLIFVPSSSKTYLSLREGKPVDTSNRKSVVRAAVNLELFRFHVDHFFLAGHKEGDELSGGRVVILPHKRFNKVFPFHFRLKFEDFNCAVPHNLNLEQKRIQDLVKRNGRKRTTLLNWLKRHRSWTFYRESKELARQQKETTRQLHLQYKRVTSAMSGERCIQLRDEFCYTFQTSKI